MATDTRGVGFAILAVSLIVLVASIFLNVPQMTVAAVAGAMGSVLMMTTTEQRPSQFLNEWKVALAALATALAALFILQVIPIGDYVASAIFAAILGCGAVAVLFHRRHAG